MKAESKDKNDDKEESKFENIDLTSPIISEKESSQPLPQPSHTVPSQLCPPASPEFLCIRHYPQTLSLTCILPLTLTSLVIIYKDPSAASTSLIQSPTYLSMIPVKTTISLSKPPSPNSIETKEISRKVRYFRVQLQLSDKVTFSMDYTYSSVQGTHNLTF